MNRPIYCDEEISVWADGLSMDKTVANSYIVVNNKTKKPIMQFVGEFHGVCHSLLTEFPIDIAAAFRLYEQTGDPTNIMPKD